MSGGESLAAKVAALPLGERKAWLDQHPSRQLLRRWRFWARAAQQAPKGDWRHWLILAGRGFGKTRAGAEWVRGLAEANGALRIALVGATMAEARAVMVEGESGLLAVAEPELRPRWEPSRGRLLWRSGAQAFLYSGENPDALRGPQHHFAWCDELAKWAYPQAGWDNLQLGLRLGEAPRTLVTTTPRPIALLKRLLKDEATRKSRGGTAANAFLAPAFVDGVLETYAGTRLGRQELDGELIEDIEGALWPRDLIEACRAPLDCARDERGFFRRVVIGVDPPAGAGGQSDACGIVAVGLGRAPSTGSGQAIGYVIGDHSVQGLSPEGWARAVAEAAVRHGADRVVAEANQGGAMVESVLRAAGQGLPVRLVHASRGKVARAEPVATLYEKGRVRHVGAFPELEDELAGLSIGGGYDGPGRSPDRADALVWALTELMLGKEKAEPRIRML